MGIGGISVWQLLIVLAIIVLLFGTKKFSNVGADLGKAVKGFKKAVADGDGLVPVKTADASVVSAEEGGAEKR